MNKVKTSVPHLRFSAFWDAVGWGIKRYFEEQLPRVREIRFGERKFYQKITDISGLSADES